MVKVNLNYGRSTLPVELRDDWDVTVFRKSDMPVLPAPQQALEHALAAPLGSPPLATVARSARSACILICDITRPVPNHLLLGPLIRCLLHAGMAPDAITVLVATGLHRPNEGAELEELVGDPWVLETVRVVNHHARNDDDHVHVGTTRSGTVVRLDRRFVEADLRLVTGLVEPHFMAGWSGGRKVIAPGVAHAETITTFHSYRYMEHAATANCVLDGNPLHTDQLEIVGMIGGALAVNVVIDERRQVSFLNFGEIVSSHLEAVDHVRRYAEVPSRRRFPTVITSCAGYPLDQNYYQTVKGMVGPMDILEPGGDLIVVSECSGGFGSSEFVDAQRRLVALGPDRFLETLSHKPRADIDEWQTEMQVKPMRVGRIHLFAGELAEEYWPLTGVNRVDDLAHCIERCVGRSASRSVAIIPEGPYVIPVMQGA